MKKYDLQKALRFIENFGNLIESCSFGMHEDWSWTADTIWEDGEFKIPTEGETVIIAGIDGSCWATPTLQVILKDGTEQMLPCYFVEGKELTPEEKAERENFTKNGFGIFSTITQDNITPLSKDLEI